MTSYRQVGERLGAYLRANNPSTQQVQGLLSDLLAGDELLHTMRDVASGPSFLALHALAGSGSGTSQRDAFLDEVSRRYLPVVIGELTDLIDGLLDLNVNQPPRFYASDREESSCRDSYMNESTADSGGLGFSESSASLQAENGIRIQRSLSKGREVIIHASSNFNYPLGFKSMINANHAFSLIQSVYFINLFIQPSQYDKGGFFWLACVSIAVIPAFSTLLRKKILFLYLIRIYLWAQFLFYTQFDTYNKAAGTFIVIAAFLNAFYWQRSCHSDYLRTARSDR